MKKLYRKSKKLLQASSLLALALSFPLKAAPPVEPLLDKAARAVAKKFVAEHPIEEDNPNLSPYFEFAEKHPDITGPIVHYLPDNTRGELLDFIGKTALNEELSPQHSLLASSIFDVLRKDQNSYLQLSFINNQIMGRHSLLGLKEINLSRFFLDAHTNYFHALGVQIDVKRALEPPDVLSHLSQVGISRLKLSVRKTHVTMGAARELRTFFQSGWNHLMALDISNNQIGDDGLRVIANSPALKNLKSLNLDNNFILSSESIAKSEILTNLLSLNLNNNHILNAGVVVIANSPNFKNLQVLELAKNNNISEIGAQAIASSQILKNLQILNLSRNVMGVPGAEAIANSQTLTKLKILDLSECYIGNIGVTAIADSQILRNLIGLNLDTNIIDNDGAVVIANIRNLTKLKKLILSNNAIGDAEKAAIKQNPIFRNTEIKF